MDILHARLVDHHCHGVNTNQLDRVQFESMLNEATSTSPLGTTFFDSMLGLAVRRWCAPVLGLPALCSAEDYLTGRSELGPHEVNLRFLKASGVSDFLVDTGFSPDPGTTLDQLAGYGGGAAHEIVRLEHLSAELIGSGTGATDFDDAFCEALISRGAVGAKSIAAYRVGLALPAQKPSLRAVREALGNLSRGTGGEVRVADMVLNGYFAWTAIELGLPLQFHVGYGDNDLNLADCDPLRLTAFLRATQEYGVPVLLLHNYPFHRNAAYLAQVFDHVFLDVGLAVHNSGALSTGIVREVLELAPFGKLLFSSDAFGLSELYYLGTTLFRRALAETLGALIDADQMGSADASRIAELVSQGNAKRVYSLRQS